MIFTKFIANDNDLRDRKTERRRERGASRWTYIQRWAKKQRNGDFGRINRQTNRRIDTGKEKGETNRSTQRQAEKFILMRKRFIALTVLKYVSKTTQTK